MSRGIKIVYSNKFNGYVPELDGQQFHIVAKTEEDLFNIMNNEHHLINAVYSKREETVNQLGNRGVLYHLCGLYIDIQHEEQQRFKEEYGVDVR